MPEGWASAVAVKQRELLSSCIDMKLVGKLLSAEHQQYTGNSHFNFCSCPAWVIDTLRTMVALCVPGGIALSLAFWVGAALLALRFD